MKAAKIRQALAKYLHIPSDTILLEVIEGKPRSAEGGIWVEVQVNDLETLTEDINFNPETSGYKKYLDKWFAEGLIAEKEKKIGKANAEDKDREG